MLQPQTIRMVCSIAAVAKEQNVFSLGRLADWAWTRVFLLFLDILA